MEPEALLRIGKEALLLSLVLAGPPVLVAMVVGLIISILQSATQVQEQTLTLVPKLLAIALVLVIGGSWMLRQLIRFTVLLFGLIPAITG